jgi:hypothetical protein
VYDVHIFYLFTHWLVHRKKDDPPSKRKSLALVSQVQTRVSSTSNSSTRQLLNPIPKISAYIRHKSESYFTRHRSNDYPYECQSNRIRSSIQQHLQTTTQGQSSNDQSCSQSEINIDEHKLNANEGELL